MKPSDLCFELVSITPSILGSKAAQGPTTAHNQSKIPNRFSLRGYLNTRIILLGSSIGTNETNQHNAAIDDHLKCLEDSWRPGLTLCLAEIDVELW